MKSKKPSRNLIIAVAALAVATIAVLILKSCIGNGNGDDPPDPPRTAEQLARYQVGDIYRTIVNTTVGGQVEAKDWGFRGIGSLLWQSQLDIVREVRAKDDKPGDEDLDEVMKKGDVKLELRVQSARQVELKINRDDVVFDIPDEGGRVLVWGSQAIPQLKGAGKALLLLKVDWIRGAVIDAVDLATKKATGKSIEEHIEAMIPTVEELEGERATFLYRPDEGVVKINTYGGLSKEEKSRLEDFSAYTESYLFPDPDDPEKTEWQVDAKNIAHLLSPPSKFDATGKLTIARREQMGDLVRLEITDGRVDIKGEDDGGKMAVYGKWEARGSLIYDLRTNAVAEGKITGDFEKVKRSTRHILFERKWTANPTYSVLIWGEKSDDAEAASRDIEPRPLEHIK